MDINLWEILTEFYNVIGPTLVVIFTGIGYFWKQHIKIKELESTISSLENGEVTNNGNLLLSSVISNVEGVKAKIIEIIEKSNTNNTPLRIDNFGLDLETVDSMFRYSFNDKFSAREIIYRGLIIDPNSEQIKSVCKGNSNLSQSVAANIIESLSNQSLKNDPGLNIELVSYSTPPVMHGFLIDEEHLLIGFTHFEAGNLIGGASPYIYVQRDRSSPFKESLFLTYKTWFGYWLKNGRKHIPIEIQDAVVLEQPNEVSSNA